MDRGFKLCFLINMACGRNSENEFKLLNDCILMNCTDGGCLNVCFFCMISRWSAVRSEFQYNLMMHSGFTSSRMLSSLSFVYLLY